MSYCIFCEIASGKMNTKILYEDDLVVAFDDINAQAPKHSLIIPKKHIATLNDLEPEDTNLVGHMVQTAKKLAHEHHGIADDGYRILINCNPHGGQEVYHIHLHLLGGRQMTWPPG